MLWELSNFSDRKLGRFFEEVGYVVKYEMDAFRTWEKEEHLGKEASLSTALDLNVCVLFSDS